MHIETEWRVGLAVALCALGLVRPAEGQVRIDSEASEITVSGLLQTQLATSSCADVPDAEADGSPCVQDVPAVDLFLRRVRLKVDVRLNDWIEARVQPDFAEVDEFRLRDAYGRLNLQPGAEHPHARITVGQFKRPFDGFQLASSADILTIERDLDVPGVPQEVALSFDELTTRNRLSDRDIGVMVDGFTPDGRVRYWLGAFNGRGTNDNGDLDTEKQVVGRLAVDLRAGSLPLEVALAGAVTDVPFTRADGQLDARYFGALEAWAELGAPGGGPHVQAGVVAGKNALEGEGGGAPDLEGGEPLASMLAWQAIGSYGIAVDDSYFFEAVEPVLRITMADPNTGLGDDIVWGLTPGVQIGFAGRTELAVNWDIVLFASDALDSEGSFKAQLQIGF